VPDLFKFICRGKRENGLLVNPSVAWKSSFTKEMGATGEKREMSSLRLEDRGESVPMRKKGKKNKSKKTQKFKETKLGRSGTKRSTG